MHSITEKYRILVSRITAVIVLFFLFTTKSHWEAQYDAATLILFLVGMVFVGIASLGRMWCSLYIAGYKDDQLVTKGPYSLCRNPLYFFSLIGAVGIGLATETITFPIVISALFALYYPFVIRSEERRLKQLFGTAFGDYSIRVPRFFPNFSSFSEPESYTVKPGVYRNHIFSALWFIWIIGVLEVIEGLREIEMISSLWSFY
jgi:protein-S-isoprenylcysteine O-methyltransferase Ste14